MEYAGAEARSNGFSLVEVLVTLVVLSIGLLGMAGLQIAGIHDNHSAYARSQATYLAQSIIDRMRANPAAAKQGNYNLTLTGDGCADTSTTAGEDLCDWTTTIDQLLTGGKGAISQKSSGYKDTFTVEIYWKDDRQDNTPLTFKTVTVVHAKGKE